ncbi:phage tail tape measure protein, partial [Dolichospermum sp. ST_sed4]|nr:phage tail tape measure protein [Dolichospermum sp. ST_sed4]
VVAFVEQADKLFVSLGDTLSGTAEEIGRTVGKIASIFGLTKQFGVGESINKVGSALNELGANSKATEGNMIDFINRLAGVANQAGISLPNVAALGALFDEA